MRIRNLTPHPLHLMGQGGATATIDPDPEVAPPRVDTVEAPAGSLTVEGVTVPTYTVGMGDLDEAALPPEEEDTWIVVSRVVAEAAPHRRDLLIPHRLERDEAGRVVGCSALGQTPAPVVAEPAVPDDVTEVHYERLADGGWRKEYTYRCDWCDGDGHVPVGRGETEPCEGCGAGGYLIGPPRPVSVLHDHPDGHPGSRRPGGLTHTEAPTTQVGASEQAHR